MNAPQSAVIGEESLNAAFNRNGKGFDQLENKVAEELICIPGRTHAGKAGFDLLILRQADHCSAASREAVCRLACNLHTKHPPRLLLPCRATKLPQKHHSHPGLNPKSSAGRKTAR